MAGGIPRGDENAAGRGSNRGRPNGGEQRALDQVLTRRRGDGLSPIPRVEPGEQILDVGLDGILAEMEAAGDHGVRIALGHQLKHLLLAARDPHGGNRAAERGFAADAGRRRGGWRARPVGAWDSGCLHAAHDDPVVRVQDSPGHHHDQAPEQDVPSIEILVEDGRQGGMQAEHPQDEDGNAQHGALRPVVGDHPDDQQNVGRVDAGAGADAPEHEQHQEVAQRVDQRQRPSHSQNRGVVRFRDRDHAPGVIDRHPDEQQSQDQGKFWRHGQRQHGGEEQARPAHHRTELGELTDRGRVQGGTLGGIESQERKRPHSPTSALPPAGWPHSTGGPPSRPDAATGRSSELTILKTTMGRRKVLIIDGDDTLWENNVYFEQAIEDFIDFLAHSTLSREQVRATLDEIERLNRGIHGYGTAAFVRNLREPYERLAERAIETRHLEHVMNLGRRIVQVELDLLPGVAPTLDYLTARHRLLLFTKGEPEEQTLKVQRSGLAPRFDQVVVTKEKYVAAYRELIREHDVDAGQAWMVGNSPRSDINPALEAGLRAVFIPHPHTWRLEHADVPDDRRLLVLQSFGQLRDHF